MIFDNDAVKVLAVTIGGTVGTITLTDINEIAAFVLVLVSIAYTTAKLIKLIRDNKWR
jgi:hypothetical protein